MTAPNITWVAEDPVSRHVLEVAEKLADTSTTVLITGESGTGKDQLARWIHERGPRRDAPLLKIDCASLPAELVESELFGHERGAFTGAVARKPGRLELAQEGTIVLDEVAALAPGMQAKLLRVLEERTFERLGGNETLRMEARLMALTNTDMAKAVETGRFRNDLFFRLNVLAIYVPPLRERPRGHRSSRFPFSGTAGAGTRTGGSVVRFRFISHAAGLRMAGKCARAKKHGGACSGVRRKTFTVSQRFSGNCADGWEQTRAYRHAALA